MNHIDKNNTSGFTGRRVGARWLLSVILSALCLAAFAADPPYRPVEGDVLTFSGGSQDPGNGDIYIIDMGTLEPAKDYPVTINRPKGAEANYPVSVEFTLMGGSMVEGTGTQGMFAASLTPNDPSPTPDNSPVLLTFAPGETYKTIYISVPLDDDDPDNYYGYEPNKLKSNGVGTLYLFFSNPDRTALESTVVQMNFRNDKDPHPVTPITNATDTISEWGSYHVAFGDYVLILGSYSDASHWVYPYSVITADQKLVMREWLIDHATEAPATDDKNEANERLRYLAPREPVGDTTSRVSFLYKITEEAMIILDYDAIQPRPCFPLSYVQIERIKQAGLDPGITPPLDDDEATVDLSASYYHFLYITDGKITFNPRFGTITTNKTKYKGNEAVKISIPFLNWRIYKKVKHDEDYGNWFEDNIRLTTDNGATQILNVSFDEQTGIITASFNAPLISGSADSTIYLEAEVKVSGGRWISPYGAWKEITIRPGEMAEVVPTDSITVTGLPENNRIYLEKQKEYKLGYTVYPDTCSFLTPKWASSDTDIAEISPSGVLTAKKLGHFTLTLTSDEVAYLLDNEEPARDDVLIKTFTVIVKDSIPRLRTTPSVWIDLNAAAPSVDFYRHVPSGNWTVKDGKANLVFTHADGSVKTDNPAVAPATGTLRVEIPFGKDGFPAIKLSEKDANEMYIPSATIRMSLTLEDEGVEFPLEATALVYARPEPLRIESLQETAYAWGTTYVSYTIHNLLPSDGYTVKYRVMSDENEGSWKEYTHPANGNLDNLPAWLKIEEDGLFHRAIIGVSITPDNSSLMYIMDIEAKNAFEFGLAKEQKFAAIRVPLAQEAKVGSYTINANGERVYTSIENLAMTKDNRGYINTIAYDIASGEYRSKPTKLLEAIFKEVVLNARKDFYVNTPEYWGKPEITLSDGNEIIARYNGSTFRIYYPANGREYTLRVHWPQAGDSYDKVYKYSHYNISDATLSNLYVFGVGIAGEKAEADEEATLVYRMANATEETISMTRGSGENCFAFAGIYATDSIEYIYFKSNKSRMPVIQSEWQSGLIFRDNFVPKFEANVPVDSIPETNWWAGISLFDNNRASFGRSLGNIIVRPVNSNTGVPVDNPEIRYVVLKNNEPVSSKKGTGTSGANGYEIPLSSLVDAMGDFNQYLAIEVTADGYAPQVVNYNYVYSNTDAWAGYMAEDRICNVVMQPAEGRAFTSASLQFSEVANAENINESQLTKIDLTNLPLNSFTAYTEDNVSSNVHRIIYTTNQNGEAVYDHTESAPAGVKIYVSLPYDKSYNPEMLLLCGSKSLYTHSPDKSEITDSAKTGFKHSYLNVRYEFNTSLRPSDETTLYLKVWNKAVGASRILTYLPGLRNKDINVWSTAKELAFEIPYGNLKEDEIDDGAKANGADLQEMAGAFDKFDITLPSGLPFTFNVTRVKDYYDIKALVAVNFLPGGPLLDMAESAQDFMTLYNDCMNAVKERKASSRRQMPSAFVGVRGYLSGVGYVNKDGTLDVTFGGGGLTLEASASVSSVYNFIVAEVGSSLEAKLAASVSFINASARTTGISHHFKMDLMVETEASIGVKIWGEGGLDVFFAGATAGIEGGGSVALRQRIHYPLGEAYSNAGNQLKLNVYLLTYAQWHFLFWSGRKEKSIFNYNKEFLWPDNDESNPFHENYSLRTNTTRSMSLLSSTYRPAYLRATGLNPLVSDVSSAAAPRYLFNGGSLAYSAINIPADNNDDRLQILTGSSSADIVTADSPSFGFDVASTGTNRAVAVYEQAEARIDETDLASADTTAVMKRMASVVKVMGAVYNGGSWTADTLSKNAFANTTPRVALQSDGHASAVWSSGDMATTAGIPYLNGELLFARYNGTSWSEPFPLLELGRNYILSDCAPAMYGDTTLIAASRRRTETGSGAAMDDEIVFISITPDNRVETFSPGYQGSNVHLKRAGDYFLLTCVSQKPDSARDVRLITVDGAGRPAGTLDSYAGLNNRSISNFRLAATENADGFDDLALLWTEAEQVADSETTFRYVTGLYAAKPGKQADSTFYLSYPVKLLSVPDDHYLASYDAHLSADGLSLKAAAAIANSGGGAEIAGAETTFANTFAVTGSSYRITDVAAGSDLPVDFGIRNEGYQPLTSLTVKINGNETRTNLYLLPGATATVSGIYKEVPDNFDGEFSYTLSAGFTETNPALRGARLRSSTPVEVSGTSTVAVVDLALALLSNNTSDDSGATLLVKVANNSPFPLEAGKHEVKAGLYASPADAEPYPGTSVKTIDVSKLYDATEGNSNEVIAFTVPNVTEPATAYVLVKTTGSDGEVEDKNDADNLIPVFLYPKATTSPGAPVIATDSLRNGKINVPYADTLRYDSADPDKVVTWTITPALPEGLSLEAATGAISGTPAGSPGEFTFTVKVENSDGSDARDVKLRIDAPAWDVSIATFTGGRVTADRASQAYDEDEIVTLTATPDAGYELDVLQACKTGDPAVPVSLVETIDPSPAARTFTFAMPAWGVTVTATFEPIPDPDGDAVKEAKDLIEAATTIRLPQTEAETEEAVRSRLVAILNPLISGTGISLTESCIIVTAFTAATAGTASDPDGTDGSFTFKVSLAKGSATAEANNGGTIAATAWTEPPAPNTYTVTIAATVNGTVSAGPTTAEAGATVTLTLVPASGYEPDEVYTTPALTLSGEGNTRSFTMPASDVSVTATFRKTQEQEDFEDLEDLSGNIEGGTYRVAQATGNDEAGVKTWLVSTLNALYESSHDVFFRSATASVIGEVTISYFEPAVAGTADDPDGADGRFTFAVSLKKGSVTLTTPDAEGVILATPYVSTPVVKSIVLQLISDLKVRIYNSGNAPTGTLWLGLSGGDADVFTLPFGSLPGLEVGDDADVELGLRPGLQEGSYTALLNVGGDDISTVSKEIRYRHTLTGLESPPSDVLNAYVQDVLLHVSGLKPGEVWRVYNLIGSLVWQGVARGSEARISLSARGTYIVHSEKGAVIVVY